MQRVFVILGFIVLLGACSSGKADLDKAPVALGDFKLGHNIAVASKARQGPLSRKASEEELIAAMQKAVAERFDRYTGDKFYHFGISVEGYVLAAPGVPLVLAPKSVLIINLTVWDDAAGGKMNEEVHQITVLETFGAGAIVGSGYTLTKEEQLEQLAQNAAKSVETFLVKQRREKGWFGATDSTAIPDEVPADAEGA